ncbi:uncharacterized protein LOC122043314 [Zingiber officinale]|uniref:uncharacterized protein LOC122043314 n=1 Tax=Zingiber officinale TaxID=94328 RepID=UPI001C4B93FD|nr:uncharacterized protein LOC122043314 [Zingiber officinale]
MGNSLRCCLACVLPCGAFDVVRIVHLSGQVEEHSCSVSAGEILAANPGHVLSKPCSSQGGSTVRRRILIVSPEAELRRGDIYFLIPAATATLHDHKKKFHNHNGKVANQQQQQHEPDKHRQCMNQESPTEKKLSQSHRHRGRTGRVGVWRPHLESICEGL